MRSRRRTPPRSCAHAGRGLAAALAAALLFGAAAPALAGGPKSLRIETAAGGNAPELMTATLAAGDTLRAFAAGYDKDGYYRGPVDVDWMVWPAFATVSPARGSTTLLHALTAGSITLEVASRAGEADSSGTLTIAPGPAVRLALFAATPGAAPSLASLQVSADTILALYAGALDAQSNLVGAIEVGWSLDTALATLSLSSGTLTVLDARRAGSGLLRLEAAGLPRLDVPLQVVPGRLAELRLDVRTPAVVTLGDTTIVAGSTLPLFAAGFDADGNRRSDIPTLDWTIAGTGGTVSPTAGGSTTLRATAPGGLRVVATRGEVTVSTGVVHIVPGPLARLRLSRAAGAWVPVAATTQDADHGLTLYALGEDALGFTLGPVTAGWSSTNPAVANPASASGTAMDVATARVGTARVVIAAAGAAPDTSGVITVVPGATAALRVETRADGSGSRIGARTLSADSTLALYAVGRDAKGNCTGAHAAAWALSSPVGSLSATAGTSVILDATRPGTAFVVASAAALRDSAGPLAVVAGAAHHLDVEDATGTSLPARTLRPGDLFEAWAGMWDRDGNSLGVAAARWSWSGDALASLSGQSETRYAWTAARRGRGRLIIDVAGVLPDTSNWITVEPGPLARLEIRDRANAGGALVGSRTLAADSTLTLFAAGFDAAGNSLGDVPVGWGVASQGGEAVVDPLFGPNTVLRPRRTGAVQVTAAYAPGLQALAGPIQLLPGVPVLVAIETAPDGSGGAVGDRALAAGDTLFFYAVGRDALGNAVGPEAVSWLVHGAIGVVEPSAGTATRFLARQSGTGDVEAVPERLPAARTGNLRVAPGRPATLLVERTPGDPADALDATALTTDDSLSAHAVLRDLFGNLVSDAIASWEIIDAPEIGALSTSEPSSSIWFLPRHPGRGRLQARADTLVATSGILAVQPGVGSGVLAVVALPETLRADGASTTRLVVGPVRDRFDNIAEDGRRVDLETDAGQFAPGDDIDPGAPGLQRPTLAGMAEAMLTAPVAAGGVNVQARSGAAAASHAVVVLPRVELLAVPGSLAPAAVVRGDTLAARLSLQNPSPVAVTLARATLRLQDDDGGSLEAALVAPLSLAPSGEADLGFEPRAVPGDLDAADYAPAIEVSGTDALGHAFSQTLLLAPGSLRVTALRILGLRAAPARVVRGDTLEVLVDLRVASGSMTLDAAGTDLVAERPGDWQMRLLSPADGEPLPSGSDIVLRFAAIPNPAAELGPTRLLARVQGRGAHDAPVADGADAALVVEIARGAAAVLVGRRPEVLTRGERVRFNVDLGNEGDTVVRLDTANSALLAAGAGFTAGLDAGGDTLLVPGEVAHLRFDAPVWPDSAAPGDWPLRLRLRGSQAGRPYAQDLDVTAVRIETPALLVPVSGGLAPERVAVSSSPELRLAVRNTGGSVAVLDATTRVLVAGREAALAAPVVIAPDSVAAIEFAAIDLAGAALGRHALRLAARGTQNGAPLAAEVLFADSLTIASPAALVAGASRPSQARLTAGQTRPWSVVAGIANQGGMTVALDSLRLRFLSGGDAGIDSLRLQSLPGRDLSAEYQVVVPAGFTGGSRFLAPQETGELGFEVAHTGTTRGEIKLEVEAFVHEEPTGRPLGSVHASGGSVRVETPAALGLVAFLSSQDEVVVGQAAPLGTWRAALVVENRGESAAELKSVAIEARVDSVDRTAEFDLALPTVFASSRSRMLAGGARDTLVVEVEGSGTTPGTLRLRARVEAEEMSSGRAVGELGLESGAVALVGRGVLTASALVRSAARVTSGVGPAWWLETEVRNDGGARLEIADPATALVLRVAGVERTAELGPSLAPDRRVLGAGESLRLHYEVAPGSEVAGEVEAELRLAAVEMASRRPLAVTITGAGPRLERPAVLAVLHLMPPRASRGTSVGFAFDLTNQGEAAAELDTSTALAVAGVRARLRAPLRVASGETLHVALPQVLLPDSSPLGPAPVVLAARGTQNGAPLAADVASGDLLIETPAALAIVGIDPSQSRVTRGQDEPWTLGMRLENSGQASYGVQSAEVRVFVNGVDRTPSYSIAWQKPGSPWTLGQSAVDTLRFLVTHTGEDAGPATLEGRVRAIDLNSGLVLEANTLLGGKGTLGVQAPGASQAGALVLSQPAATAGQERTVTATLEVRNAGEATLVIDAASLDSSLVSIPRVGTRAEIVTGGPRLAGGERATVRYTLGPFAVSAPGLDLLARPRLLEENRGLLLPVAAAASLRLETPARLQAEGEQAPERVTCRQSRPWTVRFRVENAGESEARLDDPRLVLRRQTTDASARFVVRNPAGFDSTGDWTLPGGALRRLTFEVASTDSVAGDLTLALAAAATETNSGRAFVLEAGAPLHVRVQQEPRLALVDSTLVPTAASRGQNLQLAIVGRNDGESALDLDPRQSLVRLLGTSFAAPLAAPGRLIGGGHSTLVFAPALLAPDVAPGAYTLALHLEGSENGNPWRADLVAAATLRVDAAASLQVLSVRASQARLTSAQERPWSVRVAVRNNGAAAVLEQASLVLSLGAEDVTSGFDIVAPRHFVSGNDRLAAGAVDTLGFDIRRSGDVAGLVVLDAALRARDLNSGAVLEAQTSGAARGSVRLAPAARPVLVALEPSQPRLSAGQRGAWSARFVVRNDGGSPWRPDWTSVALALGTASDDSTIAPERFDSGVTSLDAGESASATFRVLRTGEETGTLALVAVLSGLQETDGRRIEAASHPTTTLLVQAPPRAVLGAAAAILPRAPHANIGQLVPVEIQVENRGEADLARVEIALVASGATPAETLLALPLAGRGAATLGTRLRLGAVAGPVGIDIVGRRAVDANDTTAAAAWDVVPRARIDLVSEIPGALRLAAVEPSQARLSAGQGSDWWLALRLHNDGQEPLLLQAPRAADLEFLLDGDTQADYTVIAPAALAEGGLEIAGGGAGTLRYRIAATGTTAGRLEARVRLAAAHANDPALAAAAATGQAHLDVEARPGLRVLTTESVTWRRQHGFDDYRVTSGQEFAVRIVVENTGGALLDSIRVALATEGGNSQVAGPAFLSALGAGDSVALDIPVRAGTQLSRLGLPETFTARITSARDANSGLPVPAAAPLDASTFAAVETPAALALQVWIESPEGARDGTLSARQSLVLSARVDNQGQADVSAAGRLRLEVADGFQFVAGAPECSFRAGETQRWTLQAPAGDSAAPETLRVAIGVGPRDETNGAPATIVRGAAALGVRVHDTGTLQVALRVAAPDGARDGTLSARQGLEVELTVRGDSGLVERRAELLLPGGWSLGPGQARERDLAAEPETICRWTLLAGQPDALAALGVRVRARDANDASPRLAADSLGFRVQRPAELALAAAIVAPVEARGGRLVPGQRFTLRAWVGNHGEAGVRAATAGAPHGVLRLAELPAGYSTDAAARSFTLDTGGGAEVDWEVAAPTSYRLDLEALRVLFAALPVDANSGAPVGLQADSSQARIAVSLADDRVVLQATPVALQLAVPGQRRVPLLHAEIGNQASNAAAVDSLGVLVVVDGAPALDPSQILSRLHLVRRDVEADTLAVTVGAQNPVWFVFPAPADAKAAGFLAAAQVSEFTLLGDLAATAPARGLGVALGAPGGRTYLRVVEAGSRTPIPVRGDLPAAGRGVVVIGREQQAYNSPNPFHVGRERTEIHYQVESDSEVQVRIYTLQGGLVWEARRRETTSGPALRSLAWDGRNGAGEAVRNGVYVCDVRVGARSSRFKIAVVR